MSEPELEPMEPALHVFVAAERSRPGPGAAVQAEVLKGIEAAMAGATMTTGAPKVAGAPEGTPGATPRASGGSPHRRPWARLLSRPVPAATLAFVLGAGLGAWVHAKLRAPNVIYVDRWTEPQPEERLPPPAMSAAPTATEARVPAAPAVTASSIAPPSLGIRTKPEGSVPRGAASVAVRDGPVRDQSLAAERSRLDRARSALLRGDVPAALAAVEEHEKAFPAGRLLEEREVLAIEALVRAGRYAEARRKGEAFRKRSPSSLLLPAVEESLRSIP